MSEENVEIVRRIIEAIRSGPPDTTVEASVSLADPRIEVRSALTAVEGTTYQGHDGVRSYFRDLADAWQEWRNEPVEIAEIRPDAVIANIDFRAIGKDSGVAVEQRNAVVFVLSNHKVLRVHSYATRDAALEAAGLSE